MPLNKLTLPDNLFCHILITQQASFKSVIRLKGTNDCLKSFFKYVLFVNKGQDLHYKGCILVPMTYCFIFLLDSTLGSDVKSETIFLVAIFLHPVLAVWKHEISLLVGSKTGDSCVVTCHREHIDNQTKVSDCRDDTRLQPGNFSLFLRQSSLSVNNKISSYQATVELDSIKSGEQ